MRRRLGHHRRGRVNGRAFGIEARLNKAPLKEEAMAGWLERLIGHPVVYAPLPAFVTVRPRRSEA